VLFHCPHCGKQHETEVGRAHIAGASRAEHRDPSSP
jgi:hypothetical protein